MQLNNISNSHQMEDLSVYNPVSSNLRKAQMKMLSILDVFVDICEKHKIDYWLFAGTALGARRHHGFIPWDDDLDVLVQHKDFKDLLKILEKELPSSLILQSRKTDKNYPFFYAKIRDLDSVYHEKGYEKYKYKGIFIDIFPIEKVPSIKFKKVIDSVLYSPNSYSSDDAFLRRLKHFLMILIIPLANLMVFFSRLFYKKKVTGINYYSYGIRANNIFNLSHLYPVGKMAFEGKNYKVPGDIDKYLECHFGNDFMTIPPEHKRRSHASKIEIF